MTQQAQRNENRKRFKISGLSMAIVGGLGLIILLYAVLTYQRPPRIPTEQALFDGITYVRQVRSQPRPMMIHIVSVDLTAPGIEVIVSSDLGDRSDAEPSQVAATLESSQQTLARTTSEFLNETQVQIAVNGSFFYPFHEKTPWDYFPHSGDRVQALGQAIAEGIPYITPKDPWHPLCILTTGHVIISTQFSCPDHTTYGLSGGPLLLVDGHPPAGDRPLKNTDKPYARMIAATDALGDHLWLIAVDGKQPFYSNGMTLAEATDLVQSLGATQALNLDGGGSTTLVQSTPEGARPLNAPIHTKLPMRERPVANHLGIYARPLETTTRP